MTSFNPNRFKSPKFPGTGAGRPAVRGAPGAMGVQDLAALRGGPPMVRSSETMSPAPGGAPMPQGQVPGTGAPSPQTTAAPPRLPTPPGMQPQLAEGQEDDGLTPEERERRRRLMEMAMRPPNAGMASMLNRAEEAPQEGAPPPPQAPPAPAPPSDEFYQDDYSADLEEERTAWRDRQRAADEERQASQGVDRERDDRNRANQLAFENRWNALSEEEQAQPGAASTIWREVTGEGTPYRPTEAIDEEVVGTTEETLPEEAKEEGARGINTARDQLEEIIAAEEGATPEMMEALARTQAANQRRAAESQRRSGYSITGGASETAGRQTQVQLEDLALRRKIEQRQRTNAAKGALADLLAREEADERATDRAESLGGGGGGGGDGSLADMTDAQRWYTLSHLGDIRDLTTDQIKKKFARDFKGRELTTEEVKEIQDVMLEAPRGEVAGGAEVAGIMNAPTASPETFGAFYEEDRFTPTEDETAKAESKERRRAARREASTKAYLGKTVDIEGRFAKRYGINIEGSAQLKVVGINEYGNLIVLVRGGAHGKRYTQTQTIHTLAWDKMMAGGKTY